MKRTLPELPSLKQQRHLAKDLYKASKAAEPDALARIRESHPRFGSFTDPELTREPLKLADAQLVLAREYGFANWDKLKRHITRICGAEENEPVLNLVRAVAERRHADARRILHQKPELTRLDIASSNEHRALHYAVRNRDAEMTRLLLECGADPVQGVYPFREATSPRALATDRGYDDILAIFEEFDEKKRHEARCPNLRVTPEINAIGTLIRDGRDAEVLARIRSDSELLNSCDRQGETVVHHAARWGRAALLEELISAGAHLNKMNVNGERALDLAVLQPGSNEAAPGCRLVAELLLKQADIIVALATAVALARVDVVRDAARQDPAQFKPNPARRCGLLQIAVRHKQLAILKYLLELGCDPDDRHRIASLQEEVFDEGEPLWLAAGESQYDFARCLLDHGAGGNAQHYASGDPVSRAYNNRDEQMVALLASRGAQVDPITAAFEGDAARALAGLDKKPALLTRVLWAAVHGGSVPFVRECLARVRASGEELDDFDLLWSTMKMWRTLPFRKFRDFEREHYYQVFQLLLEFGLNPNAKGPWNISLLHETVFAGCCWGQVLSTPEQRARFAAMLLDAGADLNARDDELLSTPLGWSAREGRTELVKLFLDRGAKLQLPGDQPWATPLSWAEKKGHTEIVALLRSHGGE